MAQANLMVDVNHPDNPEYNGARNPDDALWVRFSSKPVHNVFKSENEQRPVFDDVVYVEIRTPGDQLNIIETPAREIHKQRFPRQWAHFKNQQAGEEEKNGTPLAMWPLLTPAAVAMLHAVNFKTVEQIAFASDQQIQSVGMHAGMQPIKFRERAAAFLKVAKDASINAQQAKTIEDMQKQMDEMRAMLEKATAPKSESTITVTKKAA
jgi:hypothetical protein